MVDLRSRQRIDRTLQLARLIESVVPRGKPGRHPATRAFQAIRIAINEELLALETVLEQMSDILAPGGRLAVISFHSLEDRLVKRFLRDQARGPKVPRHLPLPESGAAPAFRRLGSAIHASEAEIAVNPRARSAVLRLGERLQ